MDWKLPELPQGGNFVMFTEGDVRRFLVEEDATADGAGPGADKSGT